MLQISFFKAFQNEDAYLAMLISKQEIELQCYLFPSWFSSLEHYHGVRRSWSCQLLTSKAGFSFIFFVFCYMCSRHYLNQINYKIVNIVKTCIILSSSAIKVYLNNCYVSDCLELSIGTYPINLIYLES